MVISGMRALLLAAAFTVGAGLGGCGSSTTTVTQMPAASSTTSANTAAGQNNAVISSASQAPDAQAQLGAPRIEKILVAKLGLNDQLSFNLNHHIAPGDNGGDCYVKLGADAVNFENMTGNILRSPTGADVVFVQSNTATPLVKCLVAVKTALGW